MKEQCAILIKTRKTKAGTAYDLRYLEGSRLQPLILGYSSLEEAREATKNWPPGDLVWTAEREGVLTYDAPDAA